MKLLKKILNKKILLISDYDNTYTDEETEIEQKYIRLLFRQIKRYVKDVELQEVTSIKDLEDTLSKYNKEDCIIFNWCERINNTDGTETEVTKIYEKLGFTFTGADTKILKLLANKKKTNLMLKKKGIKIPRTFFASKEKYKDLKLKFTKKIPKYVIKSNSLHASTGITPKNLISTQKEYLQVAKNYAKRFNSDVVVQEFIDGEEFTAVVWGNKKPHVFSVLHLMYLNNHDPRIFTSDGKFYIETEDYVDTDYEFLKNSNLKNKNIIEKKIKKTSINVYKKLGLIDYARIDFRVRNGEVYVIDVNANPYVNELAGSEVFLCTEDSGYNRGETILKICEFAFRRTRDK